MPVFLVYNKNMKINTNIRIYAWVEFAVWLLVAAILILGIRYHHQQSQKQFKHYQIFMSDADGLIVGSPVKFLGVQVGDIRQVRIISSEVYINFVITQKDLVLPVGSIATVEFSGLGGSKALEIYPPSEKFPTDKIVAVKEPTRLNKVMGLFNEIFRDLDSIFTTVGYASNQFVEESGNSTVQYNLVIPASERVLLDADKTIDSIMNIKNNFMKNFNKEEGKPNDEDGKSEDNQ